MIDVDAIYVMHWDHNDNRHDKIRPVKEWLGTHNISSLWVTDFDGEALECKDYNCFYPKHAQDYTINRYGRFLGRGEISLRTKHIYTYYDMIKRNFDKVLVLEDDAIILGTPNDLKDIINDAPPDWDIINFSFDNTGTVNVIESTSKILAVGHEHHMSCTHGYFISRSGAQKLIDANNLVQNRGFPIDNFIQAVRSVSLYNARDSIITQKWGTDRKHMTSNINTNNDNNDNNNNNDNTFNNMKSYYSKCYSLHD